MFHLEFRGTGCWGGAHRTPRRCQPRGAACSVSCESRSLTATESAQPPGAQGACAAGPAPPRAAPPLPPSRRHKRSPPGSNFYADRAPGVPTGKPTNAALQNPPCSLPDWRGGGGTASPVTEDRPWGQPGAGQEHSSLRSLTWGIRRVSESGSRRAFWKVWAVSFRLWRSEAHRSFSHCNC